MTGMDARRWEVDPERTASKFDALYYRGLLEKAWTEAGTLFSGRRAAFNGGGNGREKEKTCTQTVCHIIHVPPNFANF